MFISHYMCRVTGVGARLKLTAGQYSTRANKRKMNLIRPWPFSSPSGFLEILWLAHLHTLTIGCQ